MIAIPSSTCSRALWDADTAMASNKAYLARAREHGATPAEMMKADRLQLHDRSERG